MSLLFKCFVGLVAICCLMQFVEMARLRRDDAAADGNDISDTIKTLIEQVRSKLDNPEIRSFIENAATAISDGTKKVTEELTKMGSSLGNSGAPAST